MRRFEVSTNARQQLITITDSINRIIREQGMGSGICLAFCPHTTAGLTINECYDDSVAGDLLTHLERMVPFDLPFAHSEGNSDAHIKSSFVGASVLVPVAEGKLCLGRWQGILLCEFDGPKRRMVQVTLISSDLHQGGGR